MGLYTVEPKYLGTIFKNLLSTVCVALHMCSALCILDISNDFNVLKEIVEFKEIHFEENMRQLN